MRVSEAPNGDLYFILFIASTIIALIMLVFLYFAVQKQLLRNDLVKKLEILQKLKDKQSVVNQQVERVIEISKKQRDYEQTALALSENYSQIFELVMVNAFTLINKAIKKTKKLFNSSVDIANDITFLKKEIIDIHERIFSISSRALEATSLDSIQRTIATKVTLWFNQNLKNGIAAFGDSIVRDELDKVYENVRSYVIEYDRLQEEHNFQKANEKLITVIQGIIVIEKTINSIYATSELMEIINQNILKPISKNYRINKTILSKLSPTNSEFMNSINFQENAINQNIVKLQYIKIQSNMLSLLKFALAYEKDQDYEIKVNKMQQLFVTNHENYLQKLNKVNGDLSRLITKEGILDGNQIRNDLSKAIAIIEKAFKELLPEITMQGKNLPSRTFSKFIEAVETYTRFINYVNEDEQILIILLKNEKKVDEKIRLIEEQLAAIKRTIKRTSYRGDMVDDAKLTQLGNAVENLIHFEELHSKKATEIIALINSTIVKINEFRDTISQKIYKSLLIEKAIMYLNKHAFTTRELVARANELQIYYKQHQYDQAFDALFQIARMFKVGN